MCALDTRARRIVERVQELRDERDELLEILGFVLDGNQGDRAETSVVEVPLAVMSEIRRRVIGGDQ